MNLVCINCPKGCKLEVEKINGEYVVKGNSCPRGEKYAINEISNPLRTVTTTIEITSKMYKRLPVITTNQVPKDKVIDVVRALKNVQVKAPIKMGDIIVKNILDLNSDIVASKTINE